MALKLSEEITKIVGGNDKIPMLLAAFLANAVSLCVCGTSSQKVSF